MKTTNRCAVRVLYAPAWLPVPSQWTGKRVKELDQLDRRLYSAYLSESELC